MSPNPPFDYIDTPRALRAFCSAAVGAPWLALDTEFLRDRTYFAKFCLLQLATPAQAACVDPLALDDLSPLDALFDDPRMTKIVHAGRQDLEILYQRRGRIPEPLFDTQVAAPFIGLSDQIGYAALAAELLKVRIEKGQTRTDWSMRPLSMEQLTYAANDVAYLGRIYTALIERLDRSGRRQWAEDDMRDLSDPGLYDPAVEDAWLRIGGAAQLPEDRVTLIQAIAQWRESAAREQDCPRNWIIKDELVTDLARLAPTDRDQLKAIRGIDQRIIQRYGNTLLQLIAGWRPTEPTEKDTNRKWSRESPSQEALMDVFLALLRLKGLRHSISPTVIATRKELRDFICKPEGHRLIQGWRAGVAGDDLLALLQGRKSLTVVEGELQVVGDDG